MLEVGGRTTVSLVLESTNPAQFGLAVRGSTREEMHQLTVNIFNDYIRLEERVDR
jgi:hypothetical protein